MDRKSSSYSLESEFNNSNPFDRWGFIFYLDRVYMDIECDPAISVL